MRLQDENEKNICKFHEEEKLRQKLQVDKYSGSFPWTEYYYIIFEMILQYREILICLSAFLHD